MWTIAGTYIHLPSSAVPSTSSHPRSHSDSAGSIGLTDLHLGGTPSDASDPPTPVHPQARVPQPGDRDAHRRQYIIPYGVGFLPDDVIAKIMTKCICRHFNGYWTSWQKVPEFDRNEICKEFQNFYRRAKLRMNGSLNYARTKRVRPSFILEPMWQDYLCYWSSDEYQVLSDKGKKARVSSKGGSLHTARAFSRIIVEQKMEKNSVGRYNNMRYSRRPM
ncbi:uncharacterized protein LOC107863161 [Capsicum annuum]|uniref:uncharacterized protein LOC107863161 n=1 Tax=Capsicum annuum TaxID=4072 RepID=UPI001FB13787|nr:uncharacterized protein LOC107863161 [Capsicum annuum]